MNADQKKVLAALADFARQLLSQDAARERVKAAGVELEKEAPVVFHALRGVAEYLSDPSSVSRKAATAVAAHKLAAAVAEQTAQVSATTRAAVAERGGGGPLAHPIVARVLRRTAAAAAKKQPAAKPTPPTAAAQPARPKGPPVRLVPEKATPDVPKDITAGFGRKAPKKGGSK